MEFEYVTGWYSRKKGNVRPLGGFAGIKDAKCYSDTVDHIVWGEGFIFVDSPEGIYIKGEENSRANNPRWFSPEEVKSDKVYLYICEYDENIRIDNYLPYDDYAKFMNGSVFEIPESKANMAPQKRFETAGMKNAEKGNIFVLTEKGYAETLDSIKPERKIGEPVREFEDCVPTAWVEKGYVKEITGTGREKETNDKLSVLKKLEQNKGAIQSSKSDSQKEYANMQHDYAAR